MVPLRIISLLPSGTEILHALGFGIYQVGRSHECDYPVSVQSLPICSRPAFPISGSSQEIDTAVREHVTRAASLYEIDVQRIAALTPTHILTQSQCAVCAVSFQEVERALQSQTGTEARLISLEPNSLADIWRDMVRVAAACGAPDAGDRLVETLTDEIRAVAHRAATSGSRPTVACIEWLEPIMAAGNWIPELINYAAGKSLFGVAGQHSPWMAWQEVVERQPEVVIALPCGFDLARTRSEMHWLTGRPGWNELPAVRNGRVYVCDGNQYMNRPGPRVVESLRILAEILHPELFPPTLEHSGWNAY